MFIDRYEQPDVIKDHKVFLNKIKKLKSYIVKFDKNDVIKPKAYLLNYVVIGNYQQSIIVITHNKCTIFTNNRIQKA